MRIFPLSENAITIEFGDAISPELNSKAVALSLYFDRHPFEGYIESVPAYAAATVFFDLHKVRRSHPESPTVFDAVKWEIETAFERLVESPLQNGRLVEIPCSFRSEDAVDLGNVSEAVGISVDEVIELFLSRIYRVYLIGFLPGFAYMGTVDERIAVPRLARPRLNVPKGSVGIAGMQTGIYPFDSPGGWQIIGRTNMEMFDRDAARPCTLSAGDEVRFYST